MTTAPVPPRSRLGAPVTLILVLGSSTALGPLAIDLYLPAFPAVAADLDATAAQVQLTLAGCLAGLTIGQLGAGPLSDRFGRRRPLLAGVAGYAVAALACALAPSVQVLLGLRFVQGLVGAFGTVIARGIVRDLASGPAASRLFSVLMLVVGVAPILAPMLGGQLLTLTGWRGLFLALAVLGGLVTVAVAVVLPETLPPQRRSGAGAGQVLRTYRWLLRDRVFVGYALTLGLAFGSLFTYVAGSPFVYQELYGVSPQLYGVLFGLNAFGLIAVTQLSGLLVGRVAPRRLLLTGVLGSTGGGACLLAAAARQPESIVWIAAPLFVIVSMLGFVMPNVTALALTDHPDVAGTASALLGATQFSIGAVAGPLVGVIGLTSAVPMAAIIFALGVCASTTLLVMARPRPAATGGSVTAARPGRRVD